MKEVLSPVDIRVTFNQSQEYGQTIPQKPNDGLLQTYYRDDDFIEQIQ